MQFAPNSMIYSYDDGYFSTSFFITLNKVGVLGSVTYLNWASIFE